MTASIVKKVAKIYLRRKLFGKFIYPIRNALMIVAAVLITMLLMGFLS